MTSTNLDTLRETLAHEIGHEVSGAEGFDQIKKAALKATKKEDRDKWAADYRRMFPGMSAPDVDEEVAMKALGRRLATPRFLDRYAENRTFMGKLIDGAKYILKYMRENQAGRLEMDELSKLIKMMDEAIIKDEVPQNEAKGESGTKYSVSKSNVNFVEDKYFSRQTDKFEDLKQGGYITVGKIVEKSPINLVGVPDGNLYFDVSKIQSEMAKHSDHLSVSVLKKIPQLLDRPVVITEYKPGQGENTVSVYGNLFTESGVPVMVGIVVTQGRGGNVISKIRTIHARSDLEQQITDASVLYLGENKKETKAWFQALGIDVPLGGAKFGFIHSIAQKSEKSTPSAKKSYNIDTEAAEQAAREAAEVAEVEKSVDQREKDLRRREQKAAKAERDAEIKRIETRARDYNAYYYKYDDIKALIDTINKEAKLGFTDVSDAAFAAYSQLNAFRAEVASAEYRKSFLETTTESLIEAADTQAGRELRLFSNALPCIRC